MAAPPAGARHATWSVGAAAAVALAAAGWIALRTGPSFDEFFTLSHAAADGAGDLWRGYRASGDTMPPIGYLGAWGVAQLLGPDVVAVRLPGVLAWGAAAACLAGALRRSGPVAAFTAGVVPSCTTLVFLGGFARPYGWAFLAVALATLGWTELRSAPRLAGAVLVGVSLAVATGLHYTVGAAAGAALLTAEVVAGRRRPLHAATMAAIAAGVAVPGLVSIGLALEAAGRENPARSVGGSLLELPRLAPSMLRPLAPLFVALVILAVSRSRGAGSHPGTDRGPSRPWHHDHVLVVGWCLAVVTPVVAVAGMAVTSGVVYQRYAVGMLAGVALLLGRAAGALAGSRPAAVALCGAVLLSGGLATWRATTERPALDDLRRLAADLGISSRTRDVVVLDAYTAQLLTLGVPDRRPGPRCAPATPYPPGSTCWDPVPDALAPGAVHHLVGRPEQVDAVVQELPGAVVRTVGEVTVRRPDDRFVVRHVEVRSPGGP